MTCSSPITARENAHTWSRSARNPCCGRFVTNKWQDHVLPISELQTFENGEDSDALPNMGRCEWQHRYHDKEDLIDALLASAHFPGLVDWKPIASFRGRWCHDGSFLGSASRVALSLQQVHPHTLIINYEHDANLRQPTFLELGNLLSMEGVRQLFAAGEKHATFLMSSAIPGD